MNNKSPSMTTVIVGALAVVGVVYVGYAFVYAPYRINFFKIAMLTNDNNKKEQDLRNLKGDQKRLGDKWDKFSLPKTVEMAAAEYGGMLKPLLGKAGLTVDDFKVNLPPESRIGAQQKKTAQHQILTFSIRAKGTLTALTKAAEQLRQVPVMHRMKQIVIDRADSKDKVGKLNIQMTIEAMIVANTDNHPSWKASSENTAKLIELNPSTRKFADIPLRDPFLGKVPPPPEPVKPPDGGSRRVRQVPISASSCASTRSCRTFRRRLSSIAAGMCRFACAARRNRGTMSSGSPKRSWARRWSRGRCCGSMPATSIFRWETTSSACTSARLSPRR